MQAGWWKALPGPEQQQGCGEREAMPAQGRKFIQWKWVALAQHYPFDFGQPRSFWKVALTYISRFWVEDTEEKREPGQDEARCWREASWWRSKVQSNIQSPPPAAWLQVKPFQESNTTCLGCAFKHRVAAGPGKSPREKVQSTEVWETTLQASCSSLFPTAVLL